MAARRPFGLVDFLLLLLVLGVAAAARVGYLAAAADGGGSPGPLSVQEADPGERAALVRNLERDGRFASRAPFAAKEEVTAHVSPGYPRVTSWLAALMPPEDVDRTMRWTQCGLGVLTAGIYFLFGRVAFHSRLVALLAGLLTALHPFWVINTAALNDGTITAFLLGLVLWLGSSAGQSGGAFSSLLFGLSAAGLALFRAALLPFSFIAVLWFLWRTRRVERGWLCAILAFLGFANGLAPWFIRNHQVFGQPVPVVTSTWLHLWAGNNPAADGGPMTESEMLSALARQRDLRESDIREELEDLPQPERYRRFASYALAEVRDHPAETTERRLNAAGRFFLGGSLAEFRGSDDLPDWFTDNYPAVLLGVLCLMLFLALIGWRRTWPWREPAMPSSLALVWIPIPYILGHAAQLHGPRLPLDGVLLTYSAFVLASRWPSTGKALVQGPKSDLVERP